MECRERSSVSIRTVLGQSSTLNESLRLIVGGRVRPSKSSVKHTYNSYLSVVGYLIFNEPPLKIFRWGLVNLVLKTLTLGT